MQGELEQFLKKISFNPLHYSFFENAKVKDVLYQKQDKILHVTIELLTLLNGKVYEEFIDTINSFSSVFKVRFELNNQDINELELNTYYRIYFERKIKVNHHLSFLSNYYLYLSDQEIHFFVQSEIEKSALENNLLELQLYFYDLGLNLQIKVFLKEIDEEELEQKMLDQKQKLLNEIKRKEESKVKIQEDNDLKNVTQKKYGVNEVNLNELTYEDKNIGFRAKIFNIDEKVTKNERYIYSIFVTDYTDSVMIKTFTNSRFTVEFMKSLAIGDWIYVVGNMEYDAYIRDHILSPSKIEKIFFDEERVDKANEKRVELHVHTKMSNMDGICTAGDYIKQAIKWGHKAIAITDHGVIQSFPDAQKEANGIKIIYGMEAYVVEDRVQAIIQSSSILLQEATYVSFDFETTGLSARYDEIIEFGAVKIKDGIQVDQIQIFIKPTKPVSNMTTKICGITNDMLDKALSIEEVLPVILKFFGNSVLVAHNAVFDVAFLNAVMKKFQLPSIKNTCIDTLPLARILYPSLKYYSLGAVCRSLGILYDEESAHRGDYDATVLGKVLNEMINHLVHNLEVTNILEIDEMTVQNPHLKLRPFHLNILVKNATGLFNLSKIVSLSHINYISDVPVIPRSELIKYREGLLFGSACLNGEVYDTASTKDREALLEVIRFYDFIEVQPLDNYSFLVDLERVSSIERIQRYVEDIIECGRQEEKLVVATGDVHHLHPHQQKFREVYIYAQAIGARRHPMYDYQNRVKQYPSQHLRTTNEMLEAFAYLGDYIAKEIVVTNTNKIADMIEEVFPVKDKLFTPKLEGAEEELIQVVYENAHKKYGEVLPNIVEKRLEKELLSIKTHKFSVIYYLAYKLVDNSNKEGYLVGSRGSVGSSFVATMANITEVNPLSPHYLCNRCKHIEFLPEGTVKSGYDLEMKLCPECGGEMFGEGQNIPFETFLGIKGDKVPDIDLNFSGEYQPRAHDYTKVLLGENNVFRAGTIGTVAEKTAYGYVKNYFESTGREEVREAEIQRYAKQCEGVKRTSGQHPGGIIVIPNEYDVHNFTPIQFPADDKTSTWKTSHFDFHAIHDEVLKLDILGHVDPTALRFLQDLTGVDPKDIPMNDQKVLSLFSSLDALGLNNTQVFSDNGALGLPEFGTPFVRRLLEETKPTKFSELIQISGLSHGTDVWNGNARDLFLDGTCTLMDVIGCRDDIMVYLLEKGLSAVDAFKIMEDVRKGKGVKKEYETLMLEKDVPPWYITSCKKIKYMFPKAHAVAYVVMALRVAWFKVYRPLDYYAVYFSVRADAFDIIEMIKGKYAIRERLNDLKERIKIKDRELTNKDYSIADTLDIALEMVERGYKFANISLEKSLASRFLPDYENNALIPPFTSIDGLGSSVGESVVEARKERPFLSKQDLMNRTSLNNTVIKVLELLGALDGIDDEDQLAFKLF